MLGIVVDELASTELRSTQIAISYEISEIVKYTFAKVPKTVLVRYFVPLLHQHS